ncbi:hypothetical protein Q7689_00505 [Nocardiopsis tropica]|uniref:hypothetical protein n=1 Tax=Nocardiopsis tropica TaxID=109330 RepID=UPI002E82A7C5|nr:hypothetical protein [Nocardiopsis tropica]
MQPLVDAAPFSRPLLTTEEAEQLSEALETIGRNLSQTLQDAAIAMGRALESDMARWRVRSLMPDLTVRGVLVDGYVAYKEA